MTVYCGESEQVVKMMNKYFVVMCRRTGLKVTVNKSKVMVLNGEEGLECEVCVDGIQLKNVSDLKYWGCNVVGRW